MKLKFVFDSLDLDDHAMIMGIANKHTKIFKAIRT